MPTIKSSQCSNSSVQYIIKRGDSLWKIAKDHYKDGRMWKIIYDANRNVIENDAGIIQIGTKLKLPYNPAQIDEIISD